MRPAAALALLLGACGGSASPVDVNSPECRACASALSAASAECGRTLDGCTNNLRQYTEEHAACFRAEGQCQASALEEAAGCHDDCGDLEQGKIERCTQPCFTDRASCAEAAVRRAGGCLDACVDAPGCERCRLQGVADFDRCDQTASACASACVAQYRGRG